MVESGYWKRFWDRRLSRRKLLTGTAVGGGALAAAAVIGCGGSDGASTATPTNTPSAGGSPGSDIEVRDARREVTPAPQGATGGTLRYAGFDALVLDTFDPHQTQFGPIYNTHSAVFSKVLAYTSHAEQTRIPDLAEDIPSPEEPPEEALTYVIKLRRGVKFHDPDTLPPDVREKVAIKDTRRKFPGLAGRELTAEDIRYSFDRQRNPDSPRRTFYYRSSQYDTIDKMDVIDDYTLRITTKTPTAAFLHFLSDTNAFIIPKEVVDEDRDTLDFARSEPESRMIGTGPFIWGGLKSLQEITAFRNPAWFGWGQPDLGRPYLDGYQSLFIIDDATIETLFRDKRIDEAFFVSSPQWIFNLKDEDPNLELLRESTSAWINVRFKINDNETGAPCTPWSDARMRQAVHLAIDRQQIIDFNWRGEGMMAGPVAAAIDKWALPREELMAIPGYRQGPEREEDIALARQLYQEAGSPEIEATFLDQPSYLPAVAPSVIEGLRRDMTANARDPVIRAGPQLAEGALKGCELMPAIVAFDNGWIDLDDWVYPYFHTDGPKNSFGLSDPELDTLLDAQRREFDEERRQQIGYQIQRYILGMDPSGSGQPMVPLPPAAFARLDLATQLSATISWPYYKNRVLFPYLGNNHWLANVWLDRDAPSYQGRLE